MAEFSYRTVRVRQTESSNWLLLFGAPASEIEFWAGVPRKKELADTETTGFQREENPTRVKSLVAFYKNPKNTVQNPLLCATRAASSAAVKFVADRGQEADSPVQTGTITIVAEPLEAKSLLELLRQVKAGLETRVPSLATHVVPTSTIVQLKHQARSPSSPPDAVDDSVEGDEPDSSEEPAEADANAAAVVFSDESHILEFWEDVAARVAVLEDAGAALRECPEFAGYTRDAMISFLRPLVVVDGQHRLRGAIESAKQQCRLDPYRSEIETAIEKGGDPDRIQRDVERRVSRILPVSLLMTDDPAEHVFQFVVVNQRATPIGRALLGTIVSTSLSNEELTRVSSRLASADIPLEGSRSIAFLSRNPESPFFRLVERGLESDKKGLLPWSVLGLLVRIFQELSGGKLYHEKNDYADKWKRDFLPLSGLVAGEDSPRDAWSAPDGPWRKVFVAFFTSVRDELAHKTDHLAKNYWGAGRESQIFNKVSLTILAADFFQYLCDKEIALDTVDEVPDRVRDWLDGVDRTYFSRDWKLSGVKKDSTGIRSQWSKLWLQYRKDPQRLPPTKSFSQPAKVD